MKKIIYISFLTFGMTSCMQSPPHEEAETPEVSPPSIDSSGFETFEYTEDGETFTMQKYFVVFLKKGPNRDQSEEEAEKIQSAHLAYLGDLYKQGILQLNGPYGDDGDIRGMSIYGVPTLEDAQKLAQNDPAVKAGRLSVEVHPWWAARGSQLK